MDDFKKYTILYIEDDEGVRTINSRFLNRMFNELYEAKDGEEGYELYKKYHPDIILTDIKMPKLDGISLAKKIRQKDTTTKIIISTAFSEKSYLMDAIELNLEKYIIKPLTSRNLLPALSKAVEALEKEKDFKITLGDEFYFDNNTSLFYNKGQVINLTKKELLFFEDENYATDGKNIYMIVLEKQHPLVLSVVILQTVFSALWLHNIKYFLISKKC